MEGSVEISGVASFVAAFLRFLTFFRGELELLGSRGYSFISWEKVCVDNPPLFFLAFEPHLQKKHMKTSCKSCRRGFTLIELLVVIVIIVTLMGILVPIIAGAQKRAVKLKAKNSLTSLVTAVDGYYNDYSRLPASNSSAPTQDSIVETTDPIMSVLAGININQMNRKQNVYYNGPAAKGSSRSSAFNGLWEDANSAELFDPWRKKRNRGYFLLLDYSYDGKLNDPFRPGRRLGNRVVGWSSGKDGDWNGSNPKNGVNKDNVYSWFD